MRKLKLEIQVSVDGFAADASGGSSWMVWNWSDDWTWDDDLRWYHVDLTRSSDCILLSRKMAEEGFHDHWEKLARDPANPQFAFAKPITETRKVVLTRTLRESRWRNTDLATGDLATEVGRLKAETGKDILVYGGPTLASSLMESGLIDELHLFVNPTVLGTGRSMFKDVRAPIGVRLAGATPYRCGVTVLRYERA